MITNCKECVYFNGECKYNKIFDKEPYIDGDRCMNRHSKFPLREFVLRETRHYLTEILEITDASEEDIVNVSNETYHAIESVIDMDGLHEYIEDIHYSLKNAEEEEE